MNKPELSIARLEASLDAKIERYFDTLDTDPDVLKQLLADKRSENTRRAYERDVNNFLKTMTGMPAVPDNVLEFLHLGMNCYTIRLTALILFQRRSCPKP